MPLLLWCFSAILSSCKLLPVLPNGPVNRVVSRANEVILTDKGIPMHHIWKIARCFYFYFVLIVITAQILVGIRHENLVSLAHCFRDAFSIFKMYSSHKLPYNHFIKIHWYSYAAFLEFACTNKYLKFITNSVVTGTQTSHKYSTVLFYFRFVILYSCPPHSE